MLNDYGRPAVLAHTRSEEAGAEVYDEDYYDEDYEAEDGPSTPMHMLGTPLSGAISEFGEESEQSEEEAEEAKQEEHGGERAVSDVVALAGREHGMGSGGLIEPAAEQQQDDSIVVPPAPASTAATATVKAQSAKEARDEYASSGLPPTSPRAGDGGGRQFRAGSPGNLPDGGEGVA